MYQGFLFILLLCGSLLAFGEPGVNELFAKWREEAIEFNKGVSDQEILEYLKFQYEIDPKMQLELEELKSDSVKLEKFLSNYRNFHNSSGIKLPTLKGMTEKDLAQLRMVFKMKKKEYYESVAAKNRLENLTKEQFAIVVEEGKKLIGNYEGLKDQSGQDQRTIQLQENLPRGLSFLKLEFIRLSESHCQFFMQKGIGKGIGLSLGKEGDEWKLWSFNEYVSWERTEVHYQ
ncbi:MAG: hypothetical protein PVG66_09105 [Chromatiales bacterium]|jgi:hypothetical protein